MKLNFIPHMTVKIQFLSRGSCKHDSSPVTAVKEVEGCVVWILRPPPSFRSLPLTRCTAATYKKLNCIQMINKFPSIITVTTNASRKLPLV